MIFLMIYAKTRTKSLENCVRYKHFSVVQVLPSMFNLINYYETKMEVDGGWRKFQNHTRIKIWVLLESWEGALSGSVKTFKIWGCWRMLRPRFSTKIMEVDGGRWKFQNHARTKLWVSLESWEGVLSGSVIIFEVWGRFKVVSRSKFQNYTRIKLWVSLESWEGVLSGSVIKFGVWGQFKVVSRSKFQNYTRIKLWVPLES